MKNTLTYKLNNGIEVTAKLYNGRVCPLTYANRTQATKAAAKLGPDFCMTHPMLGRCFYVAPAAQFNKELDVDLAAWVTANSLPVEGVA